MSNAELLEIPLIGDLTDHESEIVGKLLEVPPSGKCLLYFDSPGGSPYAGLAIMSLLLLRDLHATAVVLGECSSAALWPLAACRRRLVTSASSFFFHPMKWQSEENVGLPEAAEWARHFGALEGGMDHQLATLFDLPAGTIAAWMHPGRYVSGQELATLGVAELVPWSLLAELQPRRRIRRARR